MGNKRIRWNRGKYEPEFRILLVLPMLVFCSIGLFGFGITSSDATRYGYLTPAAFLGFLLVGTVMGAVSSALYIVDAYRELAVEAFTGMLIFKNMQVNLFLQNPYRRRPEKFRSESG